MSNIPIHSRSDLSSAKRWVIKIGSALLTNNGKGLDVPAIEGWVQQIAQLQKSGVEVVLVSSGAVAAGVVRLGWQARPTEVHKLQAAAALGQMELVQTYQAAFQQYAIESAQILLVHDDLSNRQRYLNARSALKTLLSLSVIPIVNENDTVATDEIRFGDNDTLAGLVANLVDADALLILTDQDGMYDADPRINSDAALIDSASATDDALFGMAGKGSGALGRGGMFTKVNAAQLAARSGTATIIAGGKNPHIITDVQQGKQVGTLLFAEQAPLTARKQWLAAHVQDSGCFVLDDGAVQVLQSQGKSLLPVGVKAVRGEFKRGELVRCETASGELIAKGLSNYSSDDAQKIIGQKTEVIYSLLGYQGDDELIHRDNMVLTG